MHYNNFLNVLNPRFPTSVGDTAKTMTLVRKMADFLGNSYDSS